MDKFKKAREELETKTKTPDKIIYKNDDTRVYDKNGSIRVPKE